MKKIFVIFAISLLITSCKKENKTPTANAGIDQTVNEGAIVTLDASASSDADGDALTYHWIAPLGITLSSQTEAKPTVIAPEVITETKYTFSLLVNDGHTNSTSDEMVITVMNVGKFLTSIKAGQTDGPGIKYVDIVPDDSSLGYSRHPTQQQKYLDLNGDGIDDFELMYQSSDTGIQSVDYYGINIKPLGINSVCITQSENNWVDSLKYNAIIGNDNNWANSTALLYEYHWWMWDVPPIPTIKGFWYDNDNIYIGIKIIKDDKQFFGWIDMKENVLRRYAVTVPY